MSLCAQIKTLIPLDQEVNLPIDSSIKIGMATVFNETYFKKDSLKKLFVQAIKNHLNPTYNFVLDTSGDYIELFVLFPCKSFNIENIQSHEIVNEGLITSTFMIKIRDDEYEISLGDFEWVKDKKNKYKLDNIYKEYIVSKDLKFKTKNYGILKSAEFSIIETMDNFTLIITEIINRKNFNN